MERVDPRSRNVVCGQTLYSMDPQLPPFFSVMRERQSRPGHLRPTSRGKVRERTTVVSDDGFCSRLDHGKAIGRKHWTKEGSRSNRLVHCHETQEKEDAVSAVQYHHTVLCKKCVLFLVLVLLLGDGTSSIQFGLMQVIAPTDSVPLGCQAASAAP